MFSQGVVGVGTAKTFTENELHREVFNDTVKLLGFGHPTVRIPASVCLASPDSGWAEALGCLVLQALGEQQPLVPLYYRRGTAFAEWYTYHEALLSQIRAQLPAGTPAELHAAAVNKRRAAADADAAGDDAGARIVRP